MTLSNVMENFKFLSDAHKVELEGAGFHDGHVDNFKIVEHFIIKGNLEAITTVLDNGIDINLSETGGMGSSLIQVAIRFNQEAIFELLVSKGADINFSDLVGWTPMMEAIMDDKVLYGKRLMELGVDLSIANKRGATAKMLAMKFGRQDFLSFL